MGQIRMPETGIGDLTNLITGHDSRKADGKDFQDSAYSSDYGTFYSRTLRPMLKRTQMFGQRIPIVGFFSRTALKVFRRLRGPSLHEKLEILLIEHRHHEQMLARNTEILSRLQHGVHEAEQRLPRNLESNLQAQLLEFEERMQARIAHALKSMQADMLDEPTAGAKIREEIALRIAQSEKRMVKSLLKIIREETAQLRELLVQPQSKKPPGS